MEIYSFLPSCVDKARKYNVLLFSRMSNRQKKKGRIGQMKLKTIKKSMSALIAVLMIITSGIATIPVSAATTQSTSTPLSATLSSDYCRTIGVGSEFELLAEVTGGNPSYLVATRFYYLKQGETEPKYASGSSRQCPCRNRSYKYRFNTPGVYTLSVVVENNVDDTITVTYPYTITVMDFKVNFGKTSSLNKISTQQGVQTAINVSGGKAPYKYQYSYYDSLNAGIINTVNTYETYAPTSTCSYKIPSEGYYFLMAKVTDANGVTSVITLNKSVQVVDFKANFKTSSSYSIKTNTAFKTSVSVSNGSAPYTYRFGYIKNGKTTFVKTLSSVTSASASYSYKFTEKGTYTPYVEVTDGQYLYASAKLSKVTVS